MTRPLFTAGKSILITWRAFSTETALNVLSTKWIIKTQALPGLGA